MTAIAHLLVSPEAGRGRADGAYQGVRRTLEDADVAVSDITGGNADASLAAARAAVADGAERLIVVGGDGLVHLGLQAVIGSSTVLGIVPVGTGNDFVRGLGGIPSDAAAATEIALGAATAHDAIRVTGGELLEPRWVASVATAGFSGDVNGRANALRFPRGPSRYSVATVLELPRLRTRTLTIEVDGIAHAYDATLFAVANTAWFGGGMQICPAADSTDGMLDITVVADAGRLELLRFFRLVFRGRHLEHPKVHTHRGREIRVSCPDPGPDGLEFWGDGELVDISRGDAPDLVLRAEAEAVLIATG